MQQNESLKIEDIKKRIDVLGASCKYLQCLRDNIRLSAEGKNSKMKMITDTIDSANKLIHLYQDEHYVLSGLERKIIHDMKNIAIIISSVCEASGNEEKEHFHELLAYHDSLEAAQKILLVEFSKWKKIMLNLPSDESEYATYFQPGPHHHYLKDLENSIEPSNSIVKK
jgi:hypothetical protein